MPPKFPKETNLQRYPQKGPICHPEPAFQGEGTAFVLAVSPISNLNFEISCLARRDMHRLASQL
jgi:hypothetical protein